LLLRLYNLGVVLVRLESQTATKHTLAHLTDQSGVLQTTIAMIVLFVTGVVWVLIYGPRVGNYVADEDSFLSQLLASKGLNKPNATATLGGRPVTKHDIVVLVMEAMAVVLVISLIFLLLLVFGVAGSCQLYQKNKDGELDGGGSGDDDAVAASDDADGGAVGKVSRSCI
jgi:hypothetical protein